MKTTACIMARVSSGRHQNPKHQIAALRAYCEQRGYEVVHEISTAVSGNTANEDRDDIKELLHEARKKRFTHLVLSEVSRLGRRPGEIRAILDELHGLGICVVFRQLGIETLDEKGQPTFIASLIVSVFAELAQLEREQLSCRIKSGLELARAQGKQIGRAKGSTESNEKILSKYKGVVKSLEKGLSLRECERVHQISRTTVCRVKKALEAA